MNLLCDAGCTLEQRRERRRDEGETRKIYQVRSQVHLTIGMTCIFADMEDMENFDEEFEDADFGDEDDTDIGDATAEIVDYTITETDSVLGR